MVLQAVLIGVVIVSRRHHSAQHRLRFDPAGHRLAHWRQCLFANLDLWLHGQAEWQAPAASRLLVRATGPDQAFWIESAALAALAPAMMIAFWTLGRVARLDRV